MFHILNDNTFQENEQFITKAMQKNIKFNPIKGTDYQPCKMVNTPSIYDQCLGDIVDLVTPMENQDATNESTDETSDTETTGNEGTTTEDAGNDQTGEQDKDKD